MRMNKVCLCICLIAAAWLSGSPQLFAQARITVKGKVSSDNLPLEGVSVRVKGATQGTATNARGEYTIGVDNNRAVLVFSSVGYAGREETVGSRTTLNVSLAAEARESEEVVVIGYQTVRKKNLMASVSSVGAKDLKDIPINSAAEALNGRLAGVTATTAEGSPDAEVRVRVRGGMSITGDNSPLYIVDGVQVENGLSALSPQNIQSIDVLKDAAATAIYGARGANGVVVITTKSGRPGKLTLSYNGFVGVKSLAKKLKVMSPYDYVVYQSERSRGSSTDSATFTRNFGTAWDTLSVYKNVPVVDWQDEVAGRTGITTTHNVNAMGGNNRFTYNFGYTYNNDKAIILNSNYRRHLVNLKADYRITDKIKLAVAARYTHTDVYGSGVSSEQGSSYSRLRNAVKYRPFLSATQDIDDADPLADQNVGNGLNLINPISLANAEYRKKSTDVFNISPSLTYTITRNLTFKSTFGYDYNNLIDRQFSDSITPYAVIQGGRKPIVQLDSVTRKTITNSNVLTYSVSKFKGVHDFTLLVGEETYDLRTESHTQLFRNLPLNTSPGDAFSKAATIGTSFTGYPKYSATRYTSLSFFGQMNYAYNNKYYLNFNLRADGASKFAPGRQWGYFPSGSLAWRVKNEAFLQRSQVISDLKFRFGIGTVGNNRIADYLFLTTFRNDGSYYYGLNNQSVIAYYSAGLVNEGLKWESTVNRNFGVDLGLFKDRLTISVDIYNNSSKDLLLNVPIASTYGYSTQLQNVGKTSNKGVELQLNGVIMRKKDFTWNASYNMSFNTNRVEQLGQNQKFFYPGASWGVSGQPTDYIIRVGDPVGAMYGLINDGFYKVSDFDYNPATMVYTLKSGVVTNAGIIGTVQPGSVKFRDLNGDGVIDLDKDRTIIGNPTPKFTGGLNQQFTYKNWDMSMFLNFSYGNTIYNANKIEFTNGYTANSNMLDIMNGRWKVVTATGQTAQWVNSTGQSVGIAPDQLSALNANASIWQPIKSAGAFYPSSWAMEDGSFIRLNNITVGYTVPSKTLSKMKISKLRFYVTANNLAVLTGYTGYDPEVSVRNSPLTPGLDYSAYPKSRSFIFGINATF
ncbi:SusC/RagA family TonB-linked outer membrane protein [Sediminibacterium soli]|uniref:SusC/RagA family TonB-linked outer membrane protein n=1 Tax=Sediminibacterium soli TaxID=2698829 RepID=UPI00137A9E14|nr:TonB-dependent receptor [Sediminibacterium soli]NCI47374.1 TonB-dependent receptor [Sediminibacterium soli]